MKRRIFRERDTMSEMLLVFFNQRCVKARCGQSAISLPIMYQKFHAGTIAGARTKAAATFGTVYEFGRREEVSEKLLTECAISLKK